MKGNYGHETRWKEKKQLEAKKIEMKIIVQNDGLSMVLLVAVTGSNSSKAFYGAVSGSD